ncbi:MAG TPA: hypothetical protein VNI83_06160 [Vicinamibacterales bacterium]|nr:hypothetical protein [Vicinamibacterales bacterium]
MPRRMGDRRGGVLLAIVAALQAWVAAPLHELAADDPACHPEFLIHDPSRHALRSASETPRGDGSGHCITCHWIRGLSSAAAHGDRAEAARLASGAPPPVAAVWSSAFPDTRPAPRAPPA